MPCVFVIMILNYNPTNTFFVPLHPPIMKPLHSHLENSNNTEELKEESAN